MAARRHKTRASKAVPLAVRFQRFASGIVAGAGMGAAGLLVVYALPPGKLPGPRSQTRHAAPADDEPEAERPALTLVTPVPAPQASLRQPHAEAANPEAQQNAIPKIKGYEAIPPAIETALYDAACDSGLPYDFMVRLTYKESSFRADAFNRASGASGIMQIIPGSTMLELIHKYAEKNGYDHLAPLVRLDRTPRPDGKIDFKYRAVSNAAMKDIRAACFNPDISAHLIAAHLKDKAETLGQRLARPVNQTDLYLVHFLGSAGATRFLIAHDDDAQRGSAAINHVSRAAAKQNLSIFYRKDGTPRSVEEVYDNFARTMTRAVLPAGLQVSVRDYYSQPAYRSAIGLAA